MTQTPIPPPVGFGSAIVKIALVMLVVETLSCCASAGLGWRLSNWKLALLDAGLLAVIGGTIGYFAFIRPKDKRIQATMAALEKAKLDADSLARFDALTGVLGRRALLEALENEAERARRYGGAFACLMLDLDHFKIFNDTYGHQFGDKVLQQIAQVLSGHCRTIDHLGRYGGEEFLIILPQTPIDSAAKFAERVCAAVAKTPLDRKSRSKLPSASVWRSGEGGDGSPRRPTRCQGRSSLARGEGGRP